MERNRGESDWQPHGWWDGVVEVGDRLVVSQRSRACSAATATGIGASQRQQAEMRDTTLAVLPGEHPDHVVVIKVP
ncbi:unnamed protein product [Linum trigynum]|uniref:Uncharacterized protein n=1 Tax=Linum trigynum TaxID=586398 RepID=A0AAV2E001_9ROSI